MLASLYRKLIPLSLRSILYNLFLGKLVFFFRHFGVITRSKFTFFFGFVLPRTETNRVFSFIGKHGLTSYPYDYALEYQSHDIVVELDAEHNLPYVIHNGKRLYFPETFSIDAIQQNYRSLIIEQDIRSAHRYVRSYDELSNRTLLDVGAAEGIFTLDTIEFTKQAILFEYQECWQKPLSATFEKWKDKVSIVKKFVSNNSSNDSITIDDILKSMSLDNLFIKMDIEGSERKALEGAKETLSAAKNIQLAICTYHRKEDPEYMFKLLTSYGYSIDFTDGFMYWKNRISKGVIRGKR